MSRLSSPSKTKTAKQNPAQYARSGSSGLLIVAAGTFAGVVFGVLLSVGFMKPMLQSAVASATKDLKTQVAAAPASYYTDICGTPTSTSGGQALGASTVMTPSSSTPPGYGGGGGSTGGNKTVFVHKLVSGVFSDTTGTNSNTGPDSKNVVDTHNTVTTTVTNNNDVSISNSNAQAASTGDAEASHNTTGGSATTGDSSNKNSTSLNLAITN